MLDFIKRSLKQNKMNKKTKKKQINLALKQINIQKELLYKHLSALKKNSNPKSIKLAIISYQFTR